jgi:hypothetical protein
MTTRRRILVALGVVAVALLALPAVHWRAWGWLRREPFFNGRPASYWRGQVLACQVYKGSPSGPLISTSCGGGVTLFRRLGPLDRAVIWLGSGFGRYDLGPPLTFGPWAFDKGAVPVFTKMLDDTEPKVRWHACVVLGQIGEDASPAIPALRGLAGDNAEVAEGVSVGAAARDAVAAITAAAGKDQ